MSGRPVVLVGHAHICPIHGQGVVVTGSSTSILNGRPVACVGDLVSCGATIIIGSAVASLDDGHPIARLGDVTSHGGTLIEGETDWLLE